MFRKEWDITKHGKAHLRGGDIMEMVYSQKYRKYDPTVKDVNVLTYQKGDTVWFLRTMGTVGHDPTTEELTTTTDGTVHFVYTRKLKVKYDSDLPFTKIETVNNLDDINSPVQGGPAQEVDQGDEHD
jgi:hypothetical protein